MLSQRNCTYTYKYLKEKTKTTQPKPACCGLWGEKKPNEQCCESVAKNVVEITLFFFIIPSVLVVDDSSMIFYFNL